MPTPEKNEAQWNFHKFLVGKNGVPVASFLSEVSPDSSILTQKLEEELRK
jgi:glutathione peroxidase-family protein